MASVKKLFELQQIDIEIQKLQKISEDIDRQLSGNEVLVQAQSKIDATKEQLKGLEKQQRELDLDTAAMQETVKNIQNKLYGGSIHNPKELISLEQELNGQKDSLRIKEDTLLNIMTDIETVKDTLKRDVKQAASLEAQWQQEKAALNQKQQEIQGEIIALNQKRQSVASSIDAQSLELYTNLRSKKGSAVVCIEQGMCQGCRLNLSINELQRARNSIVRCSSCGKILFIG